MFASRQTKLGKASVQVYNVHAGGQLFWRGCMWCEAIVFPLTKPGTVLQFPARTSTAQRRYLTGEASQTGETEKRGGGISNRSCLWSTRAHWRYRTGLPFQNIPGLPNAALKIVFCLILYNTLHASAVGTFFPSVVVLW